MKNYSITLSVTIATIYALVTFIAWDFTAIATCRVEGRVLFIVASFFISILAEALIDDERNRVKAANRR